MPLALHYLHAFLRSLWSDDNWLALKTSIDYLSTLSIIYLLLMTWQSQTLHRTAWFLIQGLYLEVCHSIQHHGLRRRFLEFPWHTSIDRAHETHRAIFWHDRRRRKVTYILTDWQAVGILRSSNSRDVFACLSLQEFHIWLINFIFISKSKIYFLSTIVCL